MRTHILRNSIVLSALLASSMSQAGMMLSPVRCASDNLPQWTHDLTPATVPATADATGTARGRNAWFKVCDPRGYAEVFPSASINGDSAEFDILVSQASGHRRLYPTFGIVTGTDPVTGETEFTNLVDEVVQKATGKEVDKVAWVAPTVAPPTSGADECQLHEDFVFVGLCTSGCVTPEQEIVTPEGKQAIADLELEKNPSVLVPVSSGSDSLEMSTLAVKSFVKDIMPAEQKILTITTQSGISIRVSLNHPLLTGDFTLSPAENLKVGNSLVKATGEKDPIISIEEGTYFGKLHNMIVDTPLAERSLYVVQGVISGDKRFQDESVSDLNRSALRNLVK